jgi:hypothetical protein
LAIGGDAWQLRRDGQRLELRADLSAAVLARFA